jgi:hypothetical protein
LKIGNPLFTPLPPMINCTSRGIGNTIGLSHLPSIDKVYTNLTDKLDRYTAIFITTVKLLMPVKKDGRICLSTNKI